MPTWLSAQIAKASCGRFLARLALRSKVLAFTEMIRDLPLKAISPSVEACPQVNVDRYSDRIHPSQHRFPQN